MSKHIYIRTLRNVDYAVFCVQDGQKAYYDPVFGRSQPYSSGQQVKRSVLDTLCGEMGVSLAPIDFIWTYEDGQKIQFKEGEALSSADPTFPDQLLGGYMAAGKRTEGKDKSKEDKETSFVVKRRSPLSISALRPLHPLLAGLEKENISFDRTHAPTSKVVLRNAKTDEVLSLEEVTTLLEQEDRTLPKRKYIQDQRRATGLYIADVCIDLERLFSVSVDPIEPEIYKKVAEKLKESGWKEGQNVFGPCLLCPAPEREKMIKALASALLNWRITSNQARTFSPMETLAVAISPNAQHIAGAIRARLREDMDRPMATPVLDRNAGAELFVGLPAEGYITGDLGAAADALDRAEQRLLELIQTYDFDNQLI